MIKRTFEITQLDSNSEFSPLYDPAYTMTITIGGQLSLCMLMEKLINECDAEIVMCNTDGFEYIIKEEMRDNADSLVVWWEGVTGLIMEGATYSEMFIRDVNSYISRTVEGDIKTKGAYEVAPFDELGWHKDHSSPVIAQAVLRYFIDGEDPEEYIRLHDNVFDFMLRTKVPRSSRLILIDELGNEYPQQNICRYYPSKEGMSLVKVMPPLEGKTEERYMAIDSKWKVKTCNNILDFSKDLDYDYYIQGAQDLIDAIESLEYAHSEEGENDES